MGFCLIDDLAGHSLSHPHLGVNWKCTCRSSASGDVFVRRVAKGRLFLSGGGGVEARTSLVQCTAAAASSAYSDPWLGTFPSDRTVVASCPKAVIL